MEIGRTSGVFDEHTINTKIRQIKKAEGTHELPQIVRTVQKTPLW